MFDIKMYTPEQVAEMLQLSKSTVYQLINNGEIVAKRIGKVYRIPPAALSFIFTGLDQDIYEAQQKDLSSIDSVHNELSKARKKL